MKYIDSDGFTNAQKLMLNRCFEFCVWSFFRELWLYPRIETETETVPGISCVMSGFTHMMR